MGSARNPKLTDWTVWHKVLKASVLSYQGNIVEPVGKWIDQINGVYNEYWTWWWDEDIHLLYYYINGYWHMFRHMITRRNGRCSIDIFKQYTVIAISFNVEQLQQTSVTLKGDCCMSHGYREILPPLEVPLTLLPYLQSLVESLEYRKGEK